MNIRISQKIAAVAVAIIMNAAIMGGVAYLFSNTSAHATTAQRCEPHDGGALSVRARVSRLILGGHGLAISI